MAYARKWKDIWLWVHYLMLTVLFYYTMQFIPVVQGGAVKVILYFFIILAVLDQVVHYLLHVTVGWGD